MLKHLVCLLAVAVAMTANAATGGNEPPVPVNVVSETGQDIGPCPDGALSYPPAPYKGTAYFVLQADPQLAAQHHRLTKQEAPWLQRLDGPSGTTRLFTAQDGTRAVVYWSCKPGDCGENTVYGAYALDSHEYELQVAERGHTVRSLGSDSPALKAAISCARSHDDRLRAHAAEQIKRQAGK